jgi:hypothetical protein
MLAYDEMTAERVRKLMRGRSDVAEKKMMGGLCFMVRDHMCCSVSGRGGLMVRVGAQVQDLMLREPHVRPVEMNGRRMAGFVRIAPEGYETDAALSAWLAHGLDFVSTLPAKDSPRPKRSKR